MILVSRRWSHSCMIFFQPQRCRRFDVLSDSRNSRYTREMVVRIWAARQPSIMFLEILKRNDEEGIYSATTESIDVGRSGVYLKSRHLVKKLEFLLVGVLTNSSLNACV
ncbi:hypothetical protein TNCV_3771401 [Trichonephila clavipes]|nr:hypothetical protein TNCV_3771401 [Trichonephila clavipes]